jgi:hypothetical protein
MKIVHNPDPGPMRQKAYPSTGDQIDAIWKIVDALLNGKAAPDDALKVRDAVKKVKATYVKRGSE